MGPDVSGEGRILGGTWEERGMCIPGGEGRGTRRWREEDTGLDIRGSQHQRCGQGNPCGH